MNAETQELFDYIGAGELRETALGVISEGREAGTAGYKIETALRREFNDLFWESGELEGMACDAPTARVDWWQIMSAFEGVLEEELGPECEHCGERLGRRATADGERLCTGCRTEEAEAVCRECGEALDGLRANNGETVCDLCQTEEDEDEEEDED